MKQFILKHKRLTFFLISGLLLIIYLLITKIDSVQPQPTPQPEMFKLIQTTPPGGKRKMLFTGTAILFEFNAPLDMSTVSVNVSPSIEHEMYLDANDPSILVIKPANEWTENVEFTILIEKSLSAADKRTLTEDIKHIFTFTAPQDVIHYHPYDP